MFWQASTSLGLKGIERGTKSNLDSSRRGQVLSAHSEISTDDSRVIKEYFYARSGLYSQDEIIKDLGVQVYPEDRIYFFPKPELGIGSQVVIERALPISVEDAGKTALYRSFAKIVSDFLTEKNITLGNEDKIDPSLDSGIVRDLLIKIVRVSKTNEEVFEKIAFKTVRRDDPNLEKGKQKVVQEGKEGKRKKTFEIRRENGQEISRKQIGEEVVQEPQNKIISVGTKEVILGEGIATWYDWVKGMTAASNTLPYGTVVVVTNLANGKSVTVTIVDHGIVGRAIIDLSAEAFQQLAPLSQGIIRVRLTKP